MSTIADVFGGNSNPPLCPRCARKGRTVSMVRVLYAVINDKAGRDTIHYQCTDCWYKWEYSQPTGVGRKDNENGQS